MKKIFLLIIPVVIIGMVSCNQAPSANNAMAEQNKALVDKHIQAILKGDLATMGDALADDYKGYGPGSKDSTNKAKMMADWKMNWDSVFTSLTYDRITAQSINIPEGRGKGDWVLEWGEIAATYKNGTPSVKFPFHGAYSVANNKINFSVVYYNVADILAQQGFTFVPPKKDDKKM